MKKIVVILLLSFYCTGSLFLPRGNFAYIEQIPQLYSDFCTANNNTDFFEFLEEQFFEFEIFEGADEPYEKENKPVPFYALSSQLIMAMPIFQSTEISIHHTEKTKATFIYTLKDYWVYPTSIFHPPKA